MLAQLLLIALLNFIEPFGIDSVSLGQSSIAYLGKFQLGLGLRVSFHGGWSQAVARVSTSAHGFSNLSCADLKFLIAVFDNSLRLFCTARCLA